MAGHVLVSGVGMTPLGTPRHSDPYDALAERAVRAVLAGPRQVDNARLALSR